MDYAALIAPSRRAALGLVVALAACTGGGGDTGATAGESSTTASTATAGTTSEESLSGSTSAGTGGESASSSGTSSGSTTNTTEMTGMTGSSSTTEMTGTSSTSSTTEMTGTSGTSGTTEMTGTSGTSSTTDMTSGSSGGVCSGETESCAMGETCCLGLECCAGVPVPPGKEFCASMCPKSDRNLKSDLRAIDPADVLARVVALPITTWRYTKDGPEVRHLGPMAQDFAAAFGLGDTERLIFPLDEGGVSLAAIQGLHRRLVAAEEENAALRRQLADLEGRMKALEGQGRR